MRIESSLSECLKFPDGALDKGRLAEEPAKGFLQSSGVLPLQSNRCKVCNDLLGCFGWHNFAENFSYECKQSAVDQ